ncbi:protein singed [Serratia fonticola]|uniref:DnaT-like ssDNA-binding protein n=1 Tax=Serratia fonticola TaxID=47917 RepID=UPI0008FD4A04|nr:DnaT-like ssDNA-binding protein [Serratia fonticola]OIX96220.1 protein singed [Serratia fonticola]QCR60859.1 protein singed [Serratia fonticola]
MTTFITVADVDELLGPDWTDASKKELSVLMANAWMTNLNLRICADEIPENVKLAGAYAALAAANGGLYQQKSDSGVVTSKSVDADGVSVSKSFAELATNSASLLDSNLQLALAMLRPYGASTSQIRVVRG